MTTKTCADAMKDWTAEYVAARVAVREAGSLRERADAEREARKVESKAARAGVELDILTLDEQARRIVRSR